MIGVSSGVFAVPTPPQRGIGWSYVVCNAPKGTIGLSHVIANSPLPNNRLFIESDFPVIYLYLDKEYERKRKAYERKRERGNALTSTA